MPRLTFTPGEILTAANLNVVSDQTVMVFDDAAARTAAIPSPVEGMVTYLKDVDSLEQFDGTNFIAVSQPGILQVVSTTKTDTFSAAITAPTFSDITGMSVTITPSSTDSKVKVDFSLGALGATAEAFAYFRVLRDSTPVSIGDAAGSRLQASHLQFVAANFPGTGSNFGISTSFSIIDSPNTTSAVTYKLQVTLSGNQTIFLNRRNHDTDSNAFARTASSVIAMEVAG